MSDCAGCGAPDAIYTDPRTLEPLCARCDQDAYDDAHDELLPDALDVPRPLRQVDGQAELFGELT